jgi:acid stress-induced BolA-like protein IbaG/YrbA
MNSEQLTEILQAAFPEAEVAVSGQAGKFDLRIVDDQFEGKRTIARQQAVYAIRAMTKEEWHKASLFGA